MVEAPNRECLGADRARAYRAVWLKAERVKTKLQALEVRIHALEVRLAQAGLENEEDTAIETAG